MGEERKEDILSSPTPAPSLPPLQLPPIQPHSVSFDEYISLWRGIATSIPPIHHNNTGTYHNNQRVVDSLM